MKVSSGHKSPPLHGLISAEPYPSPASKTSCDDRDLTALADEARVLGLDKLVNVLSRPNVSALLSGIFDGSSYLSGIIRSDLPRLERVLCLEPSAHFDDLTSSLKSSVRFAVSIEEAMRALRVFKNEVALLLALTDLGGVWPVMTVAQYLSDTAQTALQSAVGFLFKQAVLRGEWETGNGSEK